MASQFSIFKSVIEQHNSYLQHDKTYLIDALGDLLSTAAQSNRTLCRVWQHFAGHLYGAARGLAYFLYLWAALAWIPQNEIVDGQESRLMSSHLCIYIWLMCLPIKDPHWLAGTINRMGIWVLPTLPTSLNCEHHWNGFQVSNVKRELISTIGYNKHYEHCDILEPRLSLATCVARVCFVSIIVLCNLLATRIHFNLASANIPLQISL